MPTFRAAIVGTSLPRKYPPPLCASTAVVPKVRRQKWVPSDLSKRYQEWVSGREPELFKERVVKEMLEAIRVAGGGGGLKAAGDRQATGRAVVIQKNSENA